MQHLRESQTDLSSAGKTPGTGSLTCGRQRLKLTTCAAVPLNAAQGEPLREEGIVSKAAAERLHNTTELDYMTHIVLRMFENKKCATS